MKEDYEVGRGKPPRHSRYKKGQSGNPKGRPRGSENHYSMLMKVLSERVVVTVKGRRRTITKLQAVLMQTVNQAASGDYRHTQLLLSKLPLIEEWTERVSRIAPPEVSNEKRQGFAREVLKILFECGELKLPIDETAFVRSLEPAEESAHCDRSSRSSDRS
jgi:hypothetical protein